MFEMPSSDLFSEYRNFLTGVDFCISTLRGRPSRAPVRLEISLPPSEISDGLEEQMARTLRRYCNHRISYNRRERRAVRFDGIAALRIGVPLVVVGLVITAWATHIEPDDSTERLIADHLGFVLAWVGIWFPLDELFFYGHGYGRENRVLGLLRDAQIKIGPYEPVPLAAS